MSCGCSSTSGLIACKAGYYAPNIVTRTAMCAACDHVDRSDDQRWVCRQSGQAVRLHKLGLPCPEGRHPNRHGLVTVRVNGVAITTHGVPMWTRLALVASGDITPLGLFKVPGCGCVVRLKRRVRQIRRVRVLWRWLRSSRSTRPGNRHPTP